MKVDNEKKFDALLKNALEEYILEDINKQLEDLADIEEPQYTEVHKKYIDDFFKKGKNKKKSVWKTWRGVAAVFLCCCMFFNQSITAGIKKIYNNISTEQTDVSFNIKKKPMYIEYDLNAFPEEWRVLYIPNHMINGYLVNKIVGDSSMIEITFSNAVGDEVIYTLSKEECVDFSGIDYEEIYIDDTKGYYYSGENENTLILVYEEEEMSYIRFEANELKKEELIWIAKNNTYFYR